MNFRLLFFGLVLAGSVFYALIPDTPTRKILDVTGCSPDDANWEYFELEEFPGTALAIQQQRGTCLESVG